MSTLSLLIALVALVVAVLAFRMASRAMDEGAMAAARGAPGPGPAPGPAPANYTIKGNFKITNDCDGQQASIPAQAKIDSDLSNAAGNIKVPGTTTINLAPDPANPAGPVKIGSYTITVVWPAAAGAPAHWTRPDVFDPATGNPICQSIPCPNPRICRDMATAPRTVPFVNPTTNHDIRVDCSCTDP